MNDKKLEALFRSAQETQRWKANERRKMAEDLAFASTLILTGSGLLGAGTLLEGWRIASAALQAFGMMGFLVLTAMCISPVATGRIWNPWRGMLGGMESMERSKE